ncbi:MAG: AMP-binding protein [Pseudomonadales bacterium]|nr:AMP-binding protein [Pseudomonadales bacterium]
MQDISRQNHPIKLNEIVCRLEGIDSLLTVVDDTGKEVVKSFQELYVDTTQLISHLQDSGVESGMNIGIYASNCYDWIVWDLAIMQLNCVSVAFAQEPTSLFLSEMINKYNLSLLAIGDEYLSSQEDIPSISVGITPISIIDLLNHRDTSTLAPLSLAPTTENKHVNNTHSYVFSSGTTGKTKCLIVTNNGTEHLLNLYSEAFRFQPSDKALNFLPFSNYQQRMLYYGCLFHGVDYVSIPNKLLFASLKVYNPSFVVAPPIFYETIQRMVDVSVSLANSTSLKGQSVQTRLQSTLGGNIRYAITGMAPIKQETLHFFWDHGISLYEAFGITEAGMVAWNKPGQTKIGTVGQPAEENCVSLSEENEVIVTRKAPLASGYFEASEEDKLATFIAPNTVATGDIGEFDDQNFLRLVGRKKDAIVTKSGEKFHPESIESLIQRDTRINVAVVTDRGSVAGIKAILFVDNKRLLEVKSDIQVHVNKINASLPVYKHIAKLVLADIDPSIENGLRTKNMKLNRKAIAQHFENALSNNASRLEEVLQ